MTLKETFRKDYKPPLFSIETIKLNFILNENITTVQSNIKVIPKQNGSHETTDLLLNGRNDVTLKMIKMDGKELPETGYTLTDDSLIIKNTPKTEFTIETLVEIKPEENTLLEGLYKSKGVYCTQCEAEGFRGITYHMDRPDVMSKYEVRIEGDKTKYPVLLSNGNLIDSGDLENGRHYVVWNDPFLKPSYLFALVAGDLAFKEDFFVTMSNRKIQLRIYTDKKDITKVDHALLSLKQAMKWDEDRFGREYDLDLFNIVAVDDFNMGAMENKSLNIFNTKLLLATTDTATDAEFTRIQAVIGHEYFHNWTGDRVTCRDWFQLTLKEGLTVFRDHEFTSDLNSAPVKRIDSVIYLRSSQFNEDAGPMAHPIRPDSYIKMMNFYTSTVYEKGSEVIGLYMTILGKEGFRKGMDLYFQRHDGQAVTCEDFLAAMSDANNKDLSSIKTWYFQAGTPILTIKPEYDEKSKIYKIHVHQETPSTPKQPTKSPVLIPIKMGLLDKSGKEMELKLKDTNNSLGTETVLEFDMTDHTYEFENVYEKPVLSALRNFSAPVKMTVTDQTIEDLIFLVGHDTDPFNKWEANQILCKKIITENYNKAINMGDTYFDKMEEFISVPDSLFESFKKVLLDKNLDGNFKSMALSLPTPAQLIGELKETDPLVLTHVTGFIIYKIAIKLKDDFDKVMRENELSPDEKYSTDINQIAKRSLKNCCLYYLAKTKESKYIKECEERYYKATNMTDSMAALSAINNVESEERNRVLEHFYNRWKDDTLVSLKWLLLHASSNIPNNLKFVKTLLKHKAYNMANPNCNYHLLIGFTRSAVNFHANDGSGYDWLADTLLEVDKINGVVASRIIKEFTDFKMYNKKRQDMILKVLKKMNDDSGLSENVKEIVSKSLEN